MHPRSDREAPALYWKRLLALLLLIAVAVAVTVPGPLNRVALEWTERAAAVMERAPGPGAMLFFGFAAISAMLAFFSSTVLIPSAITAWGQTATLGLLWGGWVAGGLLSYAIGRGLGGPVLRRLAPRLPAARYAERLSAQAPVWAALLLQLALPSELPGYLLGTLRYPLLRYLVAVILGELPFALGTVFLGERFVARDPVTLALVALAGVALIALAGLLLRRRLRRTLPWPPT